MTGLTTTRAPGFAAIARVGLIAGLAGGAAEVAWITLFSQLAGGSGALVADGVTATVAPALAGTAASVGLGLAIHFALAAGLGIAVAVAVRSWMPQLARSWAEAGLVLAVLAGIWAVNFLVILPALNPGFVHIVPMPVSLASKLLFGVAAALVLALNRDVKRE